MEKYLIVTADDLGLAKSINEGIAKACAEGIVTAASIIPTGEAFDDAVKTAGDLRFKGMGAHLALTETKPLLPSSRFYKNRSTFFSDLFFEKVDLDNVYAELKAQLELLRKSEIKITHINSHEHIHMMPRLLRIFIRLAKEYSIRAIRFPRGDRPAKALSIGDNYKSLVLDYFSGRIEKELGGSGLVYTDSFIGLLDAGRFNIDRIKGALGNLKEGVTEIVTHPGFLSPEVLDRYPWHKGGETELFALTDKRVKKALKDNNIRLISFDDFLALK